MRSYIARHDEYADARQLAAARPHDQGQDADRRALLREHRPNLARVSAVVAVELEYFETQGADKREVFKTIRAVAGGEALFGPAIARPGRWQAHIGGVA